MNTRKGIGQRIFLPVMIVLAILSAILVSSVTFSQSPVIAPASPSSNQSLNCSWTAEENLTTYLVNVSWLVNSNLFKTEEQINCTSGTECKTPAGIPGGFINRSDIWNCTVEIYNGTSGTNLSVIVNISNADPIIAALGNVTVYEDQAYVTTMQAADAENDSIRWLSVDNNFSEELFTIGLNTGLISFTPTASDVGNHTMDIIALDNNQGSDTVISVFEVQSVNDTPTFAASLVNQTATEDVPFEYVITGADEENHTINFTFSISPALVNFTLLWLTNTTANLTFNHTNGAPIFSEEGNYTVNVTIYEVNDPQSNVSSLFNLEIVTINHAPILATIEDRNATQNQSTNFTLEVNNTDLDSEDTVTYSISSNCTIINSPWEITISNGSSNGTAYINQTLNNSHVICRYVNISVSDGSEEDSQIVFINITNTNDAPVISNESTYGDNNGGNNITNLSGYKGVTLYYWVNASDLDNLTYESETLTFSTNDTLFYINSSTGLISAYMNDSMVGNHTVIVNVSDDEDAFVTQVMNVEVQNNILR